VGVCGERTFVFITMVGVTSGITILPGHIFRIITGTSSITFTILYNRDASFS